MNFQDALDQDLRLTILQLLEAADGYDLNDRILSDGLASVGHRPSGDKLKTELSWLAEQGLISAEAVGTFTVAKLTTRGTDVAKGHATVPGVKRPGPDGQQN